MSGVTLHSAQWQRERELITARWGEDSLSVRERAMLAMRYDLPAIWPEHDWVGPMPAGCPLTYDRCGPVFGVTGGRAQQITRQALRKLAELAEVTP